MQGHEPAVFDAASVTYTLTEAAAVCGRSRITIRRYLDQGRFPGAFRDELCGATPAPWRIPAADLRSAGLAILAHAPGASAAGPATSPAAVEREVYRAVAIERDRHIEALEAQNRDLRRALHVAIEALAERAGTPQDRNPAASP